MPVLSNARHEAFAQALAKGKSADAAYEMAGFKANRGNATRLKANESIQKRVAELQAITTDRVIERSVIDKQWVMARLQENALAHQASNPGASNKALELIGKEFGMFVDRSENINQNYTISDTPADEAGWSDEYATEH